MEKLKRNFLVNIKLVVAPKAADITHKIKGKTKESMCDNCQDFNKIKLWTNKSLKLHTVLSVFKGRCSKFQKYNSNKRCT